MELQISTYAQYWNPTGSLGPATRIAFEAALRASDRWTDAGDGRQLLDLDQAQVSYRLSDGELRLRARLTDEVMASGLASRTAEGVVEEAVEGFGESVYPRDNFGGRTRAQAEREAQAAADAALRAGADQAAPRLQSAAQAAEQEAGRRLEQQVAAEARRRAGERLQQEMRSRRQELDRQNHERLGELRDQALFAVNAVLATAYQQAILAYARDRGAVARTTEGDDTFEIQFEIEG
jgi:hypothetical protein